MLESEGEWNCAFGHSLQNREKFRHVQRHVVRVNLSLVGGKNQNSSKTINSVVKVILYILEKPDI